MITKIVSGGQTGVDRAALDVAKDLKMPYGGWCPKGRIAEDGRIPGRYASLLEAPTKNYLQRTEWNVRDSDGTLILSWGPPVSGSKRTVDFAKKLGKPYCVVDMHNETPLIGVVRWLQEHIDKGEAIRTLNVAGPRQSRHALFNVHAKAKAFIRDVIWMQPRMPSSP